MPLFTYICANDHEHEHVFMMRDERPHVLPCSTCEEPSQRLFKTPQVTTMQPYITRAGDGIPTEIRSSKEESAYEKKHGIAHMTDGDMKQARENLGSQKSRIRRRMRKEMPDFADSFDRTEARMNTEGVEHKKHAAQKEVHDIAHAIE